MSESRGLSVRGLTKTYSNGVKALSGISLDITPGLYGLLGPNGAGKSTLMRTIATLQLPDEGEIMPDGVDVLADPDKMRRRLGYLPQQIGAYPGVSGRVLLERFAWLKGRTDGKQRRAEVDTLLDRVNLADAADRAVSTYSGGMMRRFGIAMALIGSPRLLIVDEPTAGLDPAERNRFHRVLADVAAESVVLLSTHIVEDVESLCGRLAIMADGMIVAEGTPAELTAPLEGRLWSRVVPRGEALPEAIQLTAVPGGTLAVALADSSPGPEFTAHRPTLEDAYHVALSTAGVADEEGLMNFFLREAWHEFRVGLKGGALPLIYIVLTGHILVVMTSADNLRHVGAVDIPRNAPALVYLMTAGDAFFLFFAWAWVFAQPVMRDRNALLHEVVLAAPLSLPGLLAARYVGALGVALLLGTSQILGFLAAPLLEVIGAVPSGAVADAPWLAFGWAFLIFTLPLAAGAGALYFIAALRTRGVGGAFAVAALLMAFWMVSMIVLKEGHADPFLVTLVDPSGFAETEHQVVDHRTQYEKSIALLALTPALLWNRLIWCLLPLIPLAIFIARTKRESLILGRSEKNRPGCAGRAPRMRPRSSAPSSWW